MNDTSRRHGALLLLGPTGSGKTPLGDVLEQRGLWGKACVHFDFGARLRHAVDRDLPDERLSREDLDFLKHVLASGSLLEDKNFPIAQRLLRSFLAERAVAAKTVVVLNGLPRHVGQAQAIDGLLDVGTIVWLECPQEVVLQRIKSNAGGDRAARDDDLPELVSHKLALFHQRTRPLVDHYRRQGSRVESVEVLPKTTAEAVWEDLERRSR